MSLRNCPEPVLAHISPFCTRKKLEGKAPCVSSQGLRAIVTDNPVGGAGAESFIYSYSYIFVDRDEATVGIMFTNLGLAGLTVTICLTLLLHPGIALAIASVRETHIIIFCDATLCLMINL